MMTIEILIQQLDGIVAKNPKSDWAKYQRNIVNMAIKALKQKSCEDAVSRKALYEALYEHFHEEDAPNNITEVRLGAVRNFVKDFPSVTPTSKEGKWINGDPICPCCGEDKFKDLDADIWADWQPKYCPNCGARMESGYKK